MSYTQRPTRSTDLTYLNSTYYRAYGQMHYWNEDLDNVVLPAIRDSMYSSTGKLEKDDFVKSYSSTLKASRPCSHLVWKSRSYPIQIDANYGYWQAFYTYHEAPIQERSHPRGFVHPDLDWSPDIDALLKSGCEKFISDFNLFNFIWELDEIPSLVAKLDRLDDGLLRLNLGALPLWGDVQALFNRVVTYSRKLDSLREALSRGLRVADSRTVQIDQRWDLAPWSYSGHRFISRGYRKKTFGARITGTIPQLDPINAILRQYGVDADLETVWNATPFSFLVDYLVPLSSALASFDLVVNPYVIDAWSTQKTEVIHQALVKYVPRFDESYNLKMMPAKACQEVFYDSFIRETMVWDSFDGVPVETPKALSARKYQNICALLSSFGITRFGITPFGASTNAPWKFGLGRQLFRIIG